MEHIEILMFLQIHIVQEQCLGTRRVLIFTPLTVSMLRLFFCTAVPHCRAAVITSHATPKNQSFFATPDQKSLNGTCQCFQSTFLR